MRIGQNLVVAIAVGLLYSQDCLAWQSSETSAVYQSTIESPPADLPAPAKQIPRRPLVLWEAEWIGGGTGLVSSRVDASVPLLFKKRAGPPPLVTTGFEYTRFMDSTALEVPDDLYEYSIGLTWIRPVNERWKVLTILGSGMATDNENRSSDAWQFRGGVLGIYQPNERWQWTVGAIAMGRRDLPVIPAVGLIAKPRPDLEIDLTFPRPAIRHVLRETDDRQDVVWLGAGISGTTWGYQRPDGTNDQLTYRDIRVVGGWQRRRRPGNGLPSAMQPSLRLEIGYAFARELELLDDTLVRPLDGGFTGSIHTRF